MSTTIKYYLEDLEVGMSATTSMTITGEQIDTFAKITGDYNPIHVDEEAAKAAGFPGRIAHGALSASLISAEINERTGRVKMKCHCEVGGKQICRGDAGVILQKRPKDD
jgi:3-hydroxybutyryl-CoA dehydratase